MLVNGDKIKLVNPIKGFRSYESEVFVVDHIDDTNTISFHSDIGAGMMDMDVFDKHFKKIRSWGQWIGAIEGRFGGYDSDNVFQYRTNGKKIVVRRGNFTGRASCNESDTFDLSKGLDLALARLRVKEVMATM